MWNHNWAVFPMVFAMGLNSILGADISQTNQILVPVLDFMARSRHVYKLTKVGSCPCIQKGHHTRGLHDENESMVLNTCVLPVHTELYHSRNTTFFENTPAGCFCKSVLTTGKRRGARFLARVHTAKSPLLPIVSLALIKSIFRMECLNCHVLLLF